MFAVARIDAAVETPRCEPPPLKGLLCNIDETDFFGGRTIPDGKAGEAIDQYVDAIAAAGAAVLLCNTNARRTNYRSRVWDAYWDGYDRAGPDDQPFLAPLPRDDVRAYRKMIDNMLAVHRQGIDYPARVAARCRRDGISPWISLRMNDCHNNDIPNHPFHGSFWKKHPEWSCGERGRPWYFRTCLDYGRREVRDFYMSLIVETLDRYDIDGLELDFMREPYLFRAGKEAEGGAILTGWLGEVRKLVDAAAARRGHVVRLGVRVPSTPEAAMAFRLDAAAWAKAGLIDLLTVTPRWETLEFDMPIERWRALLGTSRTTLAGGLEVRYQPYSGGPWQLVSPELAAGAAAAVLFQGADAVYLFNYFPPSATSDWWPLPVYQKTLKAMNSLDVLMELPRRVGVTQRDILAPGEKYLPPLPASDKEMAFSLWLGPVPDDGRPCEVLIEYSLSQAESKAVLQVSFDGKPCNVSRQEATKDGCLAVSYSLPATAIVKTNVHEIKIIDNQRVVKKVRRVEVAIGAPENPRSHTLRGNALPPTLCVVWFDAERRENGVPTQSMGIRTRQR